MIDQKPEATFREIPSNDLQTLGEGMARGARSPRFLRRAPATPAGQGAGLGSAGHFSCPKGSSCSQAAARHATSSHLQTPCPRRQEGLACLRRRGWRRCLHKGSCSFNFPRAHLSQMWLSYTPLAILSPPCTPPPQFVISSDMAPAVTESWWPRCMILPGGAFFKG